MDDTIGRFIAQKLEGIRLELHIANRLEVVRQATASYHRARHDGDYDDKPGDDQAANQERARMLKAQLDELTQNAELIKRWSESVVLPRPPKE